MLPHGTELQLVSRPKTSVCTEQRHNRSFSVVFVLKDNVQMSKRAQRLAWCNYMLLRQGYSCVHYWQRHARILRQINEPLLPSLYLIFHSQHRKKLLHWAAAWLKTSLVSNVPQRDPFFIVIKPSSSSRKNGARRPNVWDTEVRRDPAQHLRRIRGPFWSMLRSRLSILVSAVETGLLVCGHGLPLNVCGRVWMHIFCLLFLYAAVFFYSFHLSSHAHSHITHADIPFGVDAAPERRWCTSTVTLFSKYGIYTHTHTYICRRGM